MTTPAPVPALVIEGLTVALPSWSDRRHAVENLTLEIARNEILCVVGESGSGKSVMAKSILRLLPGPHVRVTGGRILFQGNDILALDDNAMRALRGSAISMIFQEPMTALNPLMTVGRQTEEVLDVHTDLDATARRQRVMALFEDVQLPEPRRLYNSYPHELSGGQRQRVMIAMALALEPALIIADEPTTALDVTTQAQILRLIKDLQRRHGTAVLFITHDFGVVSEIADRVAVMRQGKLVEVGSVQGVLKSPKAEYTRTLVDAVPSLIPRHVAAVAKPEPILQVDGLSKTYGGRSGVFGTRGCPCVRSTRSRSKLGGGGHWPSSANQARVNRHWPAASLDLKQPTLASSGSMGRSSQD